MRQIIALVVALALMVGAIAPAAYAGNSTGTNVALGLASFAVFNQLFSPWFHPAPRVVVERPVYRAVVVQPAPTYPTVVQYPNGRYELHGDGIYTPYQWVWIPYAQPVPPVPPPPPAS